MEEVEDEFVNIEDDKEEIKDDEIKKEAIHPELPQELSFLKIVVPTDKYLHSPKPWQKSNEMKLPPPPIKHQDFNRTAKGFLGTYKSPYQDNNDKYLYETCDL